MGFFDKKSRLMRKKINDLQSELKQAEKQGTYDLKDGVFFARLQLMGDQTMMAFNAMEMLSQSEESVIEQFLQRNGMHVEEVAIDKKTGKIVTLEVEPPQELILSMGRDLKAVGFRMIDDSERTPRRFDEAAGVYPLSVLLDVATALFAERVRRIISENESIRNNKEGARLLSWMPEIVAFAHARHGAKAVEIAREPFRRAFNKHYLGLAEAVEARPVAPRSQAEAIEAFRRTQEQKMVAPPKPPTGGQARPATQVGASASHDAAPHGPATSSVSGAGPSAVFDPASISGHGPAFGVSPSQARTVTGHHAVDEPGAEGEAPAGGAGGALSGGGGFAVDFFPGGGAAAGPASGSAPRASGAAAPPPQVVGAGGAALESVGGGLAGLDGALEHARAEVYRGLVRANSSRCVRNATKALERVAGLVGADAAVLLVRHPGQDGMMLFAQAGEAAVLGSSDQHISIEMRAVAESCRVAHAVADAGTLAVPVAIDGDVMAVLYLDARRTGRAFGDRERQRATSLAAIFAEFPDLTLGLM